MVRMELGMWFSENSVNTSVTGMEVFNEEAPNHFGHYLCELYFPTSVYTL